MHWKAIYNDGSYLEQFNPDGSENKYPDIQRDKLVQFILLDFLNRPRVILHLKPGQQLICRKRVAIHLAIGPQGKSGQEETWIVGFQENRRGVNVQSICFVFEDGHVELMDRFNPDHKLFYPVIIRKEEKI